MEGQKTYLYIFISILLSIPYTLTTESFADPYFGSEFADNYDGYMNDDWMAGREWGMGGRLHQPRCVNIPSNMSLCQNIGYQSMRLPNLLEHDTMQEVLQQSSQWLLLLNRHCHPGTKLFLCSLFSPVCLDRPIYPCRSLCESVKGGCEQHMVKYGYPWPDMLNCDKFPVDNGLCIGMVTDASEEQKCTACNQPNTFEAIVDNYCSSSSVYRTKLRSEDTDGDEKVIRSGKKIKKMKGTDPTAEQRSNGLNIYISDSSKCECGLGHNRSPDYYAMGNYVDGKFYANAFHLYERNNDELKRALRVIRRNANICESVDLGILVPNDQPQPPPRRGKSRRKTNPEKDVKPENEERPARRRKPAPTDEEIARRRTERNERRRQERIAQKKKRQQNENGQSPETPDVNEQQSKQESVPRQRNSKERARAASRERQGRREGIDSREGGRRLTPEQRRAREERRRQREMEESVAAEN